MTDFFKDRGMPEHFDITEASSVLDKRLLFSRRMGKQKGLGIRQQYFQISLSVQSICRNTLQKAGLDSDEEVE